MPGYTDEEAQRIRAREEHLLSLTEEANVLIAALQADSAERWEAYLKAERERGDLNNEFGDWILATQQRIFPALILSQLTDIMIRMRQIIREKLSQAPSTGAAGQAAGGLVPDESQ